MLFFALCLTFFNTSVDQIVSIGESRHIQSTQVNEDREYKVYLPDSYKWAQGRHYPVLYVLDGDSHFLHTAASVEFLSAEGEIPEMIVVAIASTVRVRDFTQTEWPSHCIGGGGADKFRAFLSKELIPQYGQSLLHSGFPSALRAFRRGQFVMYCLTSDPTLFQAYFALSPRLEWMTSCH